ncbi:type II secretion system inner membrane protein GspF [Sphingomonas sp. SUN039]|uniref:type II secretion system inner membrane protein GspF n=1 Tax=Sphingomonas sp. SUN039 TaxID=2937787 RepID=UPI0021644293|nr:type II secretion system inner membrane protein GspF [Sphingomonas sp. SUN039]UVO53919.1 type II secretion system inner membrane protein GspF [Sphingomonas sp. SUN039]
MAEFDYHVIDTAGRERRGSLAAASLDDARVKLGARRFYIVRLDTASGDKPRTASPLASFNTLIGPRRLSAKALTLFTRQLATLSLVTPLEEALRTIARQTEGDHVRTILDRVHAGVVEGRRLSDAMGREPRSFPPLYRAMVQAGEGAGTLPTILERLAALLERQAQMRAKITTAIAYPVILAIVATFVVMALMIFVVPKVVEQFDTVGQQLPLLTRIVIGISWFLASYWWALLIALGLLAVGASFALKDEAIRLRVDRALLRFPLIGRLTRDLHAARMARTLSTMVGSRLPLLEGLTLTAATVHNRALRAASDEIAESVRTGGSLSAALKRSDIFPPLLVHMSASGEASGQLDTMLERAADYLEREFDTFTASALSLLEPAIIVVMGGVVAAIVLSILLPILQLETLAGT